jgi:lipopolysaccharide export system permease protein
VRILWRHIAAEYLRAFLATLLAVCLVNLVVEYVDRSKSYTGEGWQRAVAELYACRAVIVGYELAPAALLLAGGIALASLRRRGEYTALSALAVGPVHLLAPAVAVSLVVAGGLALGDELLVGRASRRADEITAGRFKSYGSWRTYFGDTRWFKGQRYLYHLREGDSKEGFSNVTLYSLTDDFRLSRRIDAKRMEPLGGRLWRFLDGAERSFDGNTSRLEPFEERILELDKDPSSFRIAKGRPEQLRLRELAEQIDLRRNVGLPSERYRLALHNKIAYPLSGLPGMLLGCALALRPGRRGHLTSAIAEGFLIIVGFWALQVVFKAATLASLISPAIAAWAPATLLAAAAAVALGKYAR